MTDSERLEKVKKLFASTIFQFARGTGKTQIYEDIKWLFERAERANQLEITNKRLIEIADTHIGDMKVSLNRKELAIHQEEKECQSNKES